MNFLPFTALTVAEATLRAAMAPLYFANLHEVYNQGRSFATYVTEENKRKLRV